jgi:hypothetical protein
MAKVLDYERTQQRSPLNNIVCRRLVGLIVLIGLAQSAPSAVRAASEKQLTAVTAIFSQPTSPARIDRCIVRTAGDNITLDVALQATGPDVTDVAFSLGMYNVNLALNATVTTPYSHIASPSRHVHVHFRWNDSVGSETRFVRCAISSVDLSDGTSWTQAPDFTQRDWKGNLIR